MQGTKVMHIFVLLKRKRTMNVDNVKSQMRKGMLEYCIMLLLHKEPAYASDITEKGEAFLGELELSWKELNETVNHIASR